MLKVKCRACDKEFRTFPSRLKVGFGIYCSKACGSKINKNALGHKGVFDEKNINWKGDNVSYGGLHHWIITHLGRPKKCEICKSTTKSKYEWANKDHSYKRKIEDWLRLCTSCHRKYDIVNNNYRIAFIK